MRYEFDRRRGCSKRWSMCFTRALQIVGPWKVSTNLLRQTFGERFLKDSNFRMKSIVYRSHSRQFRHKKDCGHASDAITYPLIQEAFAFLESNLLMCDYGQNFVAGLHSKQIWKRCCKKSGLHYNANPSLTIDCHYKFGSAACWMIVRRFTSSQFSRNCPGAFDEEKPGK